MSFKFKVLRPTLWFCKNDEVSADKLQSYFSAKGVHSLVQYGYLSLIDDESLPAKIEECRIRYNVYSEFHEKTLNMSLRELRSHSQLEADKAITKLEELKKEL
jgi:hypothetical protein